MTNLKLAQERGELPAVRVLEVGEGDEGTAMLEIVHDLAPGAELLFHSGLGTVPNHLTALSRLLDAGVHVIASDAAFLDEPVFQQGMLSAVGDEIAAHGVSFHASAGNEGDSHAERVPAVGTAAGPDAKQGPFTDCGEFPPTNTVAIAPGGDTTFDVRLTPGAVFFLQWSEPRAVWPTPGQGGFTDLDLYLMDAEGTRCLARSTGSQGNGMGDTRNFPGAGLCPAKENGMCLFFGTSAASPHSAACAALILQAFGTQTPVAEVNRRLSMTAAKGAAAQPGTTESRDASSARGALGAGLLDCMAALK